MKKLIFLGLIAAAGNLMAQVAPGGVSGGGTNELWWDASSLNLSNYSKVSSFTDKSGNGNDATQAINSKRPRFKVSDPVFSGKSSVFFDGNDILKTGPIANLNTNTQTLFVIGDVYNNTSTGTLIRTAYTSGGSTTANSGYFMSNYRTSTDYYYQLRKTDGTNIINSIPLPSGRYIAEMVWNGVASLATYKNGNLESNVAGSDATPAGNLGVSIGGNYISPNPHFKGWLGEVIMYSKALNPVERILVENYLSAKYQIAISNDLYPHDPMYSYDLIGIGKESTGESAIAYGENITISNPSTFGNGDYLLVAHDNGGYGIEQVDVPNGEGARYNQIWKVERLASPGQVDISMDVSVNTLGSDSSKYKLLVNMSNSFATGSTIYSGSYLNGTVTFSNVYLPKNGYFTLYNDDSEVIESTGVTNDWHLTTTWSCGCIPTLNSDVNILVGHTVEVNTQDAKAAKLTVSGILNLNSTDTLFVNGDLINDGSISSGTATVNMLKTTSSIISGNDIDFYNLYITTLDTVTNSVGLTTSNKLYVSDQSVFATGDDVRLLSDASGTAYLSNPKWQTINGDLTVERFLSEGESWYLLGPSVTDGNLEDWNQEFEMQGFLGTDWPGGSASVFYYDQNNNVSDYYDGYTKPINTTDVINEKTGWYIYIGDDGIATGDRTIDMTGTPALGNIIFDAIHLEKIGNVADDGWSLFANPYAAPVKWGDVVKTGAFDEAQYKKADGSNGVMDDSFILAPGEGFWVHSNVGGSTITFNRKQIDEDASDDYNLKVLSQYVEEIPQFRITLSSQNKSDECFVGFNDNATSEKEPIIDAYKLPNSYLDVTNVSTLMEEDKLLRNIMNSNVDIVLPIKTFVGLPQEMVKEYKLQLTNIEEVLSYNKKIVLEDRALNTFTDITTDYEIEFSMLDSNKDPRFFLHITTPLEFSIKNVACYGAKNGAAFASTKSNKIATFNWKNSKGELLKSEISTQSKIENLEPGNYEIDVEGVKQKFTIVQPQKRNMSFIASYGGVNYGEASTSDDDEILVVNVGEKISFELNDEESTKEILWDFGDLTVSQTNNPTHIYFNEGEYKVKLTNKNNCLSSHKLVKVVNDEIISNHLNNINVFTQSNIVNVLFNNSEEEVYDLNIINSLGQIIFSKTIKANENHKEVIALNNIANGVYLVSVKNDEATKTKKIVISNK